MRCTFLKHKLVPDQASQDSTCTLGLQGKQENRARQCYGIGAALQQQSTVVGGAAQGKGP
eukprot:1355119-Pleurochrysis_carterae.AAC.5